MAHWAVVDRIARAFRRIRRDGVWEYLERCHDEFGLGRWYRRDRYAAWIRKYEPTTGDLGKMRTEAQAWSDRPKISIVTPVFNPSEYALTECLQSVTAQLYDHWELCLVDGASDRPYVSTILKRFSERDSRIRHQALSKNLGIAGNTNEALRMASGEFVAFLDHDDTLAPFALYEVVKLLDCDPSVDFIFSDEDKLPSLGAKRYAPFFKPDWAPDTFLSYNYLCHFAVVRKTVADRVGGLREGYDGSQDYDFILRVVEETTRIRRIPKILYHWRASDTSVASDMTLKPYAYPAGRKALSEHLEKQGLDAEVADGFALGAYRVKYRVRPSQRVSVVIPTKDRADLLERCVSSLLNKTRFERFDVVIVDNQSENETTRRFLESLRSNPKIRVLRYDRPFNFSAINNYALRCVDSEHVVFLNNDTEVIEPDWLTAMLEFAQRPDVGAVGAKLYYPDDTVQHAGVVIGLGGVAGHVYRGFPRSNSGEMGRLRVVQNMSAVTAACMMTRRAVLDEVGGFDERLSHAYNDVDLCLRMRERGYLIVFTPFAELYHHESASRGYDVDVPDRMVGFAKEVEFMKTRWKHVLDAGDPYYNPNVTLERPDFSLRR